MVIIDDRAGAVVCRSYGSRPSLDSGKVVPRICQKHLTLAELEDAVEELSKTIWLAPAVVLKC